MTSKEKIAWLKRYGEINRHINELLNEMEHWWCVATNRTQTLSDMPHYDSVINKSQAAIEKIIEIEHQVDDEVDKLSQVKSEIISAIKKLPDATYRYVLAMVYIKESKISEIAKALKCSRHKVYTVHDKAINELNIL